MNTYLIVKTNELLVMEFEAIYWQVSELQVSVSCMVRVILQLCLNDCMKSLESFDEIKPTCHATVPIRTCVGCMCACQFNTCKTNVQQIEVTCPLLALGLVLLRLFFWGGGFLFISYLCLSAARQAGCSFSFVWFGLFGWLVSPFVNVLFACFLSFHAAVDQVLHRVFYPSSS